MTGVIAWLRAKLCCLYGHKSVALRRITPWHTMTTVEVCARCGVDL